MRLAVVAVAAALAACSPPAQKKEPEPAASMTETVKPGQWRTTVSVLEMAAPGLPAAALEQLKAQPPIVTTDCSTSDDIKDFTGKRVSPDGACSVTRMDTGAGRIDGETTCTTEGMNQTVKVSGTYASERVEMLLDMSMQSPAGVMTQKMRVEAERIGDCPG